MKKSLLGLLFTLVWALSGTAQQTEHYTHPEAKYEKARDMFQKQQYVAAQKLFLEVLHESHDASGEILINAEFYAAVCALELYNRDAELLVDEFIKNHPHSPRRLELHYVMANHMFSRKKYRDAVKWFELIAPNQLSKEQQLEYRFKLGYSYFETENYDKAKEQFIQVKDSKSSYAPGAKYYYGHIAYEQKQYETALKHFLPLQNDEQYGPIVPYYIAQIYYQQEKYDELFAISEKLLSGEPKRKEEIERMIGEAYYQQEDYAKAAVYLENYRASKAPMKVADYYKLGYSYYKMERYQDAIGAFNRIVDSRDSLAQNAYYHLADCYLKEGMKPQALSAFSSAAGLKFNPEITESARFNYAKLSYEVGNPYNDPGRELQKFLEDYPNSKYFRDASNYLIQAYMSTKDYDRALKSLERLPLDDPSLRQAYQKIALYRGLELFNNRQWQPAIDHFDKSLTQKIDQSMVARAIYWKAEAQFQQNRFKEAVENYLTFQGMGISKNLPEYHRSNYGVGYAYFQDKDYNKSATYLKRYVDNPGTDEKAMVQDGWLRLADSYYAIRGFFTAVRYYESAIQIGGPATDYGYFQKAICQGLQGKSAEKIVELRELIQKLPGSDLVDDAWYELAVSQMESGKAEEALASFDQVVRGFPSSFYRVKAMLQMGLIYYNTDENDRALTTLKQLVSEYPNAPEVAQAVKLAERIYTETNDIEGYAAWIKEIKVTNVSDSQLDSLSYDAAFMKYTQANFEAASAAFDNYLKKYGRGIFYLNAHYYKGQSDYKLKRFDDCLMHFDFLALAPANRFQEEAVVLAAYLYYTRENYNTALERYAQLERIAQFADNKLNAQIGLMRCYYKLKNFQKALEYANRVKVMEKADADLIEEARIIIARSAYEQGNTNQAMEEFQWVEQNSKNIFKAEAKYYIALIFFYNGEYENSQKKIFDLLQNLPSYKSWGNKALLLLAKNYWALEDFYQANYTLEQIIARVDDPEVVQEARIMKEEIQKMQAEKEAERRRYEEYQNHIDSIQGPPEFIDNNE